MLGYAIETRPARRKASPTTLMLIAAGHAALILAVVNAKVDAPGRPYDPPIVLRPIPIPQDPPPNSDPRPSENTLVTPPATPRDPPVEIVPIPLSGSIELGPMPPFRGGEGIGTIPEPPEPIVRVGPKPTTPANVLRPPYPEAKRRLEQEAVLRLRLTIDDHGRVEVVMPGDPDYPA